jgi:uncharacterized membrane protein
MTDGAYRKRLAQDLPRWREAGWVSSEGASAILASLQGRSSAFGLAAIVGLLGGLLLGVGFLAFIAANWSSMPRIVRFEILLAALAAAYTAAGMLAARELRAFSEAALLVAGLLFAASIALVGQTYHLAGDFSGALMLWDIGILGAALVTGSSTLTVLGLAGAGYWTWVSAADYGIAPTWNTLGFVLAGTALALRIGSLQARRVAVAALGVWIGVNIVGVGERYDWTANEALAAGSAAALWFWAVGSVSASSTSRPLAALGHTMLWPGIAAFLVVAGIVQTATFWGETAAESRLALALCALGMIAVAALSAIAVVRRGARPIDAAGAVVVGVATIALSYWEPEHEMAGRLAGGIVVLAAALWAVNMGQTGPQRVGKSTGLAAFGAEVIYLYVVTLGTLIDTALAFLLGGVLFIALAFGLYRLDRRLAAEYAAETPPGAA